MGEMSPTVHEQREPEPAGVFRTFQGSACSFTSGGTTMEPLGERLTAQLSSLKALLIPASCQTADTDLEEAHEPALHEVVAHADYVASRPADPIPPGL